MDVLAIQPDGKVLVGGTFDANGQFSNLARLNADGSFDASFAGSPGAMLYLSALKIDSRGHILAGGMASPNGAGFMRRLLADRSVDTAFGPDIALNNSVRAIALLPDAKLMIAGSFSTLNGTACGGLARLNADGTVDPVFHLSAEGVNTLVVQADGAVLLGGSFDQINGVPHHYLSRLRQVRTLSATSAKVKGGPVTMTWKAISGQNYRIESSADLQTWSFFNAVTASIDHIDFVDSNWSVTSKRFFRLVLQP